MDSNTKTLHRTIDIVLFHFLPDLFQPMIVANGIDRHRRMRLEVPQSSQCQSRPTYSHSLLALDIRSLTDIVPAVVEWVAIEFCPSCYETMPTVPLTVPPFSVETRHRDIDKRSPIMKDLFILY